MGTSRFQAFVEYLLDNLFDVTTIVVAGYLVVRHQVTPFTAADIIDLATWILAVLGLIAVSGLWDRNRRLRRIEQTVTESRDLVWRRMSAPACASDFLLAQRELSDDTFASANTILLSGFTLMRTSREYMHVLGQRLVAGAHIRFIIVDPALDALHDEIALRSVLSGPAEHWRKRLQTVETVIDTIAQTRDSSGTLEIGYLPYIPSFGLVIVDPDQPHAVCYVELYHHRSVEAHPAFVVRKTSDPLWYDYFSRQYEALWESCRVERLPRQTGDRTAH
jgi:hypothetical protein